MSLVMYTEPLGGAFHFLGTGSLGTRMLSDGPTELAVYQTRTIGGQINIAYTA